MPLGRAHACPDLNSLLQQSDFVTLHVPDTEQTRNMIGAGNLIHCESGNNTQCRADLLDEERRLPGR